MSPIRQSRLTIRSTRAGLAPIATAASAAASSQASTVHTSVGAGSAACFAAVTGRPSPRDEPTRGSPRRRAAADTGRAAHAIAVSAASTWAPSGPPVVSRAMRTRSGGSRRAARAIRSVHHGSLAGQSGRSSTQTIGKGDTKRAPPYALSTNAWPEWR